VDIVELLEGEAPFVADTSAWWRFSSLPSEIAGLIRAAVAAERMWITPIVRMEVLYSARSSAEYIELETDLDALRILRNDRAVTDAAMS
jgi:predicted nucleic acid-binding protein